MEGEGEGRSFLQEPVPTKNNAAVLASSSLYVLRTENKCLANIINLSRDIRAKEGVHSTSYSSLSTMSQGRK